MSRYKAIVNAIRLMEAIEHIDMKGDREILQGIAQDVRYGGKWTGDFEKVAEALDHCEVMECAMCSYQKTPACRAVLKGAAADAIRQLAKDKAEMESAANEHIEALLEKIGQQEDEIERLTAENEELKERIGFMIENSIPAEDGLMDPGDGFPAEDRAMADWQRDVMDGLDNDPLPF